MARVEENKDKPVRCSFCGKLQSEVGTLIAGPGVYICDECIDICQSIINEEPDAKRKKGKCGTRRKNGRIIVKIA